MRNDNDNHRNHPLVGLIVGGILIAAVATFIVINGGNPLDAFR
jgi:hypothetical protein